MIIDAQLQLSSAQAVTAAAASTNYIDLGSARDIGVTEELYIAVSVSVAATAAGAATVQFQLQTDDNAGFSSPVVVSQTDAIAKTALTAGYTAYMAIPPGTSERYLRLYYNVATGPLTAGTFSAALVTGIQKSIAYADGI